MSDTTGFQGPGYFDAEGNWVSMNGTTLNSRPITTPNSSTGQPSFADPGATGWSAEFAQPSGGALTTTPNSRTGAPAPGIRTVPGEPMQLPGATPPAPVGTQVPSTVGIGLGGPSSWTWGDLINSGSLGFGAASSLLSGVASGNAGIRRIQEEAARQRAIAASKQYPDSTNYPTLAPITQTGPAPSGVTTGGRAVPPSFGPPIPPGGLPPQPLSPTPSPFVHGPLLAPGPGGARAPAIQARPGAVTPGAPMAAAPPAPQNVNLGYYRPSVGNARGATFVPGQFGNPANPAPQIYRGPQTAWGVPLQGQGPVGSQNYYTAGSAPVGPGDWTGTGPPAGALATPTGGGNARGGGGYNVAGIRNNLPNNIFDQGRSPVARAPVIQPSYVYPRTNAPAPSKDINAVPLKRSYNPFQLFGTPT